MNAGHNLHAVCIPISYSSLLHHPRSLRFKIKENKKQTKTITLDLDYKSKPKIRGNFDF